MQKYEQASKDLIEIQDGEETTEFLDIWKNSDKNNLIPFSDYINDWNGWYRDVNDLTVDLEYRS